MRLRVAADAFGSPGRRLEIARGARAFGGTVNTHSGVVSALSAAGALRVFSELLAMGGWQGRVPSRVRPEGQQGTCRCVRVAGGEQARRLPRASAHVIQRAVARHSHGQRMPTFGVQIRVSVQRHAARVLRARRICAVGTRKMFCARWRMHSTCVGAKEGRFPHSWDLPCAMRVSRRAMHRPPQQLGRRLRRGLNQFSS